MKEDASMVFMLISAYKSLRNVMSRETWRRFGMFWSFKVLSSTQVVAWWVLLNKMATRDNLGRRGVVLESNRCVMCGGEEETVNHAFFSCKIA